MLIDISGHATQQKRELHVNLQAKHQLGKYIPVVQHLDHPTTSRYKSHLDMFHAFHSF